MFEFDAGKLVIVAIVALIFIGPKDLPRVMRQVGQVVGRLRRMAAEFQAQFVDAMNEAGLDDIKTDVHKLAESSRIDPGLDPLGVMKTEMVKTRQQIEAPVAAAGTEVVASVPVAAAPSEIGGEAMPAVRSSNE